MNSNTETNSKRRSRPHAHNQNRGLQVLTSFGRMLLRGKNVVFTSIALTYLSTLVILINRQQLAIGADEVSESESNKGILLLRSSREKSKSKRVTSGGGNAIKCTFCENLNKPDLVVPHTGGKTCGSIKLMANEEVNESDVCAIIQQKERVCCPVLPGEKNQNLPYSPPTTIFVISLQGTPGAHESNNGRLDLFKEKWRNACGSSTASSTHIEQCPTPFDTRRGYGLTQAWILCLWRARQLDEEAIIFLEDDARLFENSTQEFCDVKRRGELLSKLPRDTLLAFLGGHTWSYEDSYEDSAVPYRRLRNSYGTYGFVVPRGSIDDFHAALSYGLLHGSKDRKQNVHHNSLDPEPNFYRAAREYHKRIYAFNPLVVWHEGGYSNTWGEVRGNITGLETKNQGIKVSSGMSNTSQRSMTKMNAGADFSSKLKTTQIGVVQQQESKCTFCEDEGVNFNHDLLVPHTGGNTCDSIKLMAAGEVNGSDVCATLQKEESVCCPLRARTGTSLTPQPPTNDDFTECGEVLITSQGGVASSKFIKALQELVRTNSDVDADLLKHKSASCWKRHNSSSIISIDDRHVPKRRCFSKVLVVIGDPVHTIESTHRRFGVDHLNKLKGCAKLGAYRRGTTLDQIYKEMLDAGKDLTGITEYVRSWHEASKDRLNWPEIKLVTTATLHSNAVKYAKWLGVKDEDLHIFSGFSFDTSERKTVNPPGVDTGDREKVFRLFENVTKIIADSSKLKTTKSQSAVQQQELKRPKPSIPVSGEVATTCTFCEDEGVNFNHDLLVPHTGGNTCTSIKLMAAGEMNGSNVCATLQKEESVCCPLRARTGTSLTPQPPTNDDFTECGEVLITSQGGVASSKFIKALQELVRTNSDVDADLLKHKSASCWKRHNSSSIISIDDRHVPKRRCFSKVLVVIGDPVHTIESTHRRFGVDHLNKLKGCAKLGAYRRGTTLDQIYKEMLDAGKDLTGITEYVRSWHEASKDRLNWPEIKLVTTATLHSNAVKYAKWLGVKDEDLHIFSGFSFDTSERKTVNPPGVDTGDREKVFRLFENVTKIIADSSKLKTTKSQSAVQQQELKRPKPSIPVSGEVATTCTFCEDEGVNFNHDLLVPHTGGNTCTSIKLMAAGEMNGSNVCATLQKEESVCCPLRARTGTSLTPQPPTNDDFTECGEVLITSQGGVASSKFIKALQELVRTNSDVDADLLKHKSASCWKRHNSSSIISIDDRHVPKRRCFSKVLVVIGDPVHTIESTHRRFGVDHLNKLKGCAKLGAYRRGTTLDQIYKEMLDAGKDLTGITEYVRSWHEASKDRLNWPEIKLVTTATLHSNAVKYAKWLGVKDEDLHIFSGFSFDTSERKTVNPPGVDTGDREKVFRLFENVTKIIADSSKLKTTKSQSAVQQQELKRPKPSIPVSGEVATTCTFCEDEGVSFNHDLLVPHTGGNTCTSIKLMAAGEVSGSNVCATLQKEESVCCPVPKHKALLSLEYWNQYRLADGIKGYDRSISNDTYVCKRWPGSILCEYLKKTKQKNDISTLVDIVSHRNTIKLSNVDIPGVNTTVIHLRLGDGLCGRYDLSQRKCRGAKIGADNPITPSCWENDADCFKSTNGLFYAYPRDYYEPVARDILEWVGKSTRIVVVADPSHWTRNKDMRNGDYSIDFAYRDNVVSFFRSKGFIVQIHQSSGRPDDDFVYMCSARNFVRGGGAYSRLVSAVVLANGGRAFEPRENFQKSHIYLPVRHNTTLLASSEDESHKRKVDKQYAARPSVAWEIMPVADHVDATLIAQLKPATLCACAKCGTTSLWEELFNFVQGKSFKSMNYTGSPGIHTLSNKKLWTNIQAERKKDWSNFKNQDSFALIRDPKERIISAWKSIVTCDTNKEILGHRLFVPSLLKLAGSSNIVARTDPGFPCLDMSDYLAVLAKVHAQGKEGLLEDHFLPQHLGCFKDVPPSMWTVVTTISDPNARCSLRSVVLKSGNMSNTDDGCQMIKTHSYPETVNLTRADKIILDKITSKEYEMLGPYLVA